MVQARDNSKHQISKDTIESLKAGDSSRVSFKQKSSDTIEYIGAICNHDLCVILEHNVLKQDELNVAGVTDVPKRMARHFVPSFIHMLLGSETKHPVLDSIYENTRHSEICKKNHEDKKLKIHDNSDGQFEIAGLWKFMNSPTEGDLINLKVNHKSPKYNVTKVYPFDDLFQEYVKQNKMMHVIKMSCFDEQQMSEKQHHVFVDITENTRNAKDDAAAAILLVNREIDVQNKNAGDDGTSRLGSFETSGWVFEVSMIFIDLGILKVVGWQNAHLKKQKRKRTIEPVFRPSQQQQQKAIALALGEMAPNDEYGSYTSEGMYNDLNDGRYEKTKNVKTWTGRTITVVISPEKDTRFMKKEIERKTGIPEDHQCLVAEGRVLMDNAQFKESGLSDGRTIELTAKLLGGMKHKSLSPKPMETERDKKRKKLNRAST